ncbi:uncharacterized protein V1510DRAFT_274209 [Dipodascopsis tothii]|uniref:uncharacterized protein n=1 Tax=Dipodascopsis tothii TaxID=44089 RepID=UPI0034CF0128
MVRKKIEIGDQVAFSSAPYRLPYDTVAAELSTSLETGLDPADAKRRLDQYDENKLDGGEGVPMWKVLLKQAANAMILVLLLAMGLSYGVNDYVEGGVITAVVVLNITIGFVQEYRAEQTMDSLRSLSSPTATVYRDGNLEHIPSIQVVPGDIVEVKTGDVIPADLRLFETMNLETDEALLTGESLPVLKDHNLVAAEDLGAGDRINLAYSSSVVTKGRGKGIVIATGMATEIGKIAASLGGNKRKAGRSLSARKYGPLQPVKGMSLRIFDAVGKFLGLTVGTPLQRKLAWLAYVLLLSACVLALIVFGVNSFDATHEVTIYAISLGIAIIPESLMAVLTITMAVGMKRMVTRKVIVRKLDALEALGGVTNICSDKTGTLTQGKMITRKVWVPADGFYGVDGSESAADPTSGTVVRLDEAETRPRLARTATGRSDATLAEKSDLPAVTPGLGDFLTASALCNLATVRYDDAKERWQATGDPTEIALQVFAHRFGRGRKALLAQGWTQLAEYPFDSDVKRMSVVMETPFDPETQARGDVYVLAKGAVERVIDLCVSVGAGETAQPMTPELREQVLSTVSAMASEGLRVLAITQRRIASPKPSYLDYPRDLIERELALVGLAGLYDPPRLETKGAVLQCARAGIRVHMLTGDHPGTAAAIAREVGIVPANLGELPAEQVRTMVMTASEFDALDEDAIDQLPQLPLVIARCAPQTKVRMIEALHRRKCYAAMTGDGVNDSPSLKMADVGIAMGLGGSDVAKSASDIVLTDDNFSSIVSAVEEGRRMFDNIQKFVLHLLVSNVAEVVLLVVGLAFKDDNHLSVFPLSPLQILWINMLTSSFPAFGLSLEPANPDIMERPPHDTKKGVFSWEIIVDTVIYGVLMGACCLMSFVIIIFAHADGNLGSNCNSEWNASCHDVFRVRAVMFSQITWLILVSSWEFKSIRRSMFMLNRSADGRFTFFRDMYANKFLFYSVVIGALSVIPVIYIPTLNDKVFKMTRIGWEWSLMAAVLLIYVIGIESWKAAKRAFGLFEVRAVEVEAAYSEKV